MTAREELEAVAQTLARQFNDAAARLGIAYHHCAVPFDGDLVTIARRRARGRPRDAEGLPKRLRTAAPSRQNAFRAIEALRAADAPSVTVGDIARWIRKHRPDEKPSLITLYHATADLRRWKLAWQPDDRGWAVGSPQQSLPFCGGQSGALGADPPVAQMSGGADAPVRRYTNGRVVVHRPHMWVPGVKAEGGLVVTDAKGEMEVFVLEGKFGEIKTVDRLGRERTQPAVKAEVLSRDGQTATVKLAGQKVRVRVLGEWHAAGEAHAPAEAASV